MVFKFCTAVFVFLTVFAGIASAQVDPFGNTDRVYIDSVAGAAGEDVTVTVNVRNDEALGSLSIPIVYNTELLTLKSVSFTGTRVEYINTKIITPSTISAIDGHFVVAVIQMQEDPIPVGDGPVMKMVYTIDEEASVGSLATIDTLFYPPGGALILAGPNVSGTGSFVIEPEFEAGKVTVREHNRAPSFATVPDAYVIEGDTLELGVTVNDPDGDNVTLAVTSKPAGSRFVDHGDGRGALTWTPSFVGPQSADGSPFVVSFWASDGNLSSERVVQINVVNANRAPRIEGPSTATVMAGELLSFSLSAFDPDFENITWQASGLPSGATFNNSNPASVSWQSSITDSGSFNARFIAADPSGLSDTSTVAVAITPVALYQLAIDSTNVFPGEQFDLSINLENELPVTSLNLLFNFDPSALSLLSLTSNGTLTDDFEYFNHTVNANGVAGNVRIIALSDLDGTTNPILPGSGTVAECRFRVTGDLAFAGMQIPVVFRFMDQPINDDNTLGDTLGMKIPQEDILHTNGFVKIHDVGQIRIGDINLNGLAAEIGDVIYFTNFFINPALYSFNALQYANSDVNRDNIGATVSDLVALINIVINGGTPGKVSVSDLRATVSAESVDNGLAISYDAGFDLGAALVVLNTADPLADDAVTTTHESMTLDYRRDGELLKVLVYSMDGDRLPAGESELIRIDGLNDYSIERIEMGSADGENVEVVMASSERPLPTSFVLEQNYPNPFNPDTRIDFSLPGPSQVSLTVYNVLGRSVRRLVAGEMPAGNHSVTWNGTDDNGQSVASGVYLYRLEADSHVQTRKMLLLK